ncbi:MAG: hypothetical protein PIR02_15870 [Microbacterium enclense]
MPDHGLLLLGGKSSERHPFTVEDILADEGGQLVRRGEIIYAEDFANDYGNWTPVFQAGSDGASRPDIRSPLSRVKYPGGSALRIAAPGQIRGQGTATDAIVRLARPRATTGLTQGAIVSFGFYYSLFVEYLTSASGGATKRVSWDSFGAGIDNQAWDNSERAYFTALAKSDTGDVNAERWQLRGARSSASNPIQWVDVPASRGASGLVLGYNENKTNFQYGRLTARVGTNAEYLELQMGGRAIDLRGIAAVQEPIQFGADNTAANFRGGFNPFFSYKLLTDALEVICGGIYVTRLTVSYKDELDLAA